MMVIVSFKNKLCLYACGKLIPHNSNLHMAKYLILFFYTIIYLSISAYCFLLITLEYNKMSVSGERSKFRFSNLT